MAPLLLAAGLVAGVAACGGRGSVSPTETVDLSNVTVDQAYPRMAQALTREGQVLHTRVRVSSEQWPDRQMRPYSTTEFWIDASGRALREEFRLDPSVNAYDMATERTLIVVDRYVYAPDDPDEALRSDVKHLCPQNSDPLIAHLLECDEMQLSQDAVFGS